MDVHELQEDLLVMRGTDTQVDPARLSKSRSLREKRNPAAQGVSPTSTLDPVVEADESKVVADGGGHDLAEAAPSLLPQRPSGEDVPARLDSGRAVFEDEPPLQSSPSKMVLLQSNPGLSKLADEVPTDAVPIEHFEDVSNTNWGLDMLVRVGESWAPNLLNMTSCVPSLHVASGVLNQRDLHSCLARPQRAWI